VAVSVQTLPLQQHKEEKLPTMV